MFGFERDITYYIVEYYTIDTNLLKLFLNDNNYIITYISIHVGYFIKLLSK